MSTLSTGDNIVAENINSTTDWITELFQEDNFRHSWPWTTFFIVIYAIIFILGIFGNFIVILVYCRRRQMRTVTNLFIVNLAVADLFVILFCVPVNLMSNIFIPWILGTFMCKGAIYIQGISVFASAYFLAAISTERCKGIYRFMPLVNNLTKFQALLIITVIWIAAFIILLPWPIIFEVTPIPENGTALFCVESWTDELTGKMYFLFGNLMCCYAIPGIIMCITNTQVCWRVSNRTVPLGSAAPKYVTNHHQKVKLGVTKMLSLVTFTFLLSWLPLYVVMCRVKFTVIESMSETELDILDVLIPMVQLLGTSNSCVNPILYAYMNSRFREMCKSVFHIPNECNWPCCQTYGQRTNNQRFFMVIGRSLGNSNAFRLRNGNVNFVTQDSNPTSSSSISPRGDQYCCQRDAQDMFRISHDRERLPFYHVEVTPYLYTLEEIRLLNLTRETSV